jgi:hypothetical protein
MQRPTENNTSAVIKFYHFLYVQIYLMNLKRWSMYESHNFLTNITLFVTLLVNVSTVVYFSEIVSRFHLVEMILIFSKSQFMAIISFLFSLQLFYFSYKGRYKKILNDFGADLKLKTPKYYYFGTIYIFGSLFIYGLTIAIAFNVNNPG